MNTVRSRVAGLPRLLLLAAAVLAVPGCASRGRPILSSEERAMQNVAVTVENQNFKDAVIYAIWGAGPRQRLGLVTGNSTQTFTTPARAADMRVEVDFIAGDDVVTESMGVFSGDHIHVTIPPGAN